MIDLGTGNNNKINWPMSDKQEVQCFNILTQKAAEEVALNRFLLTPVCFDSLSTSSRPSTEVPAKVEVWWSVQKVSSRLFFLFFGQSANNSLLVFSAPSDYSTRYRY